MFRQPWPKRAILNQESNVTAIKLYFKSCEIRKNLDRFPSWVLRGPLDDDNIITSTVHEGLMSDEELYHRGLLKQIMRQNRAVSRDGKRKITSLSSSRLSRTAVACSSNETGEELTPEELAKVREELDEYVSGEEDPIETEKGSDIVAHILADIPYTLDGVSVSSHFKGTYSALFEVNIEGKDDSGETREHLRRPLIDELSAVNKAVGSGKRVQYRENCKEKKDRLREQEDKLERERVDKKRRLMKGDAYGPDDDFDLPVIDGISFDATAFERNNSKASQITQDNSNEIELNTNKPYSSLHPLNSKSNDVNIPLPGSSNTLNTSLKDIPIQDENFTTFQDNSINCIAAQTNKCFKEIWLNLKFLKKF